MRDERSEQWQDWESFKRWAEPRWFDGARVIRLDKSKPFCPANCTLGNDSDKLMTAEYATNTSGCKGVSLDGFTGLWRAYITHKYKRYWGGRYHSYDEAVAARRKLERKYHVLEVV